MKKEIFPTLITPYAEKLDRNLPWNEYPRPSMKRDSFFCLNGVWDFAVTRGEEPSGYEEKILVPFPPESLLSGQMREISREEVMLYRRFFTPPKDFLSGEFILHIGAVDTVCEVFLNKKLIAYHEGGYLPISVSCSDALLEGENELIIKVKDDLSGLYPYGKQKRKRGGMWYTLVSGIWQTVWAECVPTEHIERLKITSGLNSARIEIIGGAEKKRLTLSDGSEYSFSGNEIIISPKEINHWSPENPYLYRFTLECGEDKVESYFALREIDARVIDGIPHLTLNGKPYLFNGLLDQGYFPDGIFLPATSDGYRDDILRAKSLGFNMLRKHIKIEPEIFYYLCDSLGMVVFQDMVNNSGYSFIFDTALPTVGMKRFPDTLLHRNKKSREIFISHMKATIEHLYNFPSILYYTIFNEGWGQFNADDMYRLAKSIDPSRIIDSTSGWFVRKESDVDSRHVYFKPIKVKALPTRPLVISEFGGYSHRIEGHLFGKANYGYRLFDKKEDFSKAFFSLYEKEVLPLIDKGISALVYTQLTDVEDETNGLVTYDRRIVKLDEFTTKDFMKKLSKAIENS